MTRSSMQGVTLRRDSVSLCMSVKSVSAGRKRVEQGMCTLEHHIACVCVSVSLLPIRITGMGWGPRISLSRERRGDI